MNVCLLLSHSICGLLYTAAQTKTETEQTYQSNWLKFSHINNCIKAKSILGGSPKDVHIKSLEFVYMLL